jgi:glycosyltransferase involved in cell wall biosynthesis
VSSGTAARTHAREREAGNRRVDVRNVLHASGAPRALRNAELAALRAASHLQERRDPRDRRPPHAGLAIVAFTPTYVPGHRRGAEITLHAELSELAHRGHEIRVVVGPHGTAGAYDGVDVLAEPSRRVVSRLCAVADVLVAQLGDRHRALRLAAYHDRPLAYFVHIGNVQRRRVAGSPELTVFSSNAVRATQPWVEAALVVHPPVDADAYRTSPGDCVTLVNVGPGKGADVFFALARRFPERKFLGVRTSTERHHGAVPPNVEITGPVGDMREVYGRTHVLLVPSRYESYGRVALEAAASGIPAIARSNAGPREAMGDAALWVDGDDPAAWAGRLTELDDPAVYTRWSGAATARFAAVAGWFTPELDALERALVALATSRA